LFGGLNMAYRNSKVQAGIENTDGSVTIMFAFCASVILLSLVVSVDYARAILVSQKLTLALDAAALAGAKLLDVDGISDGAVKDRANKFFAAEVTNIGSQRVTYSLMSPDVNRSQSTVKTEVAATIKTYFGGFVGIPSIQLNKSSTVSYKMRKIELAMALDVTGSMADVPAGDVRSKIESLQVSSKDLVDALFARSINDNNIRIALAPYSSGVNAGSYAGSVTNGLLSNGCVVERSGANNTTDAPASGVDSLTVMADPTYCPAPTVTPLSGRSDQNSLKSAINAFTPYGGTAGHLGTAWAWYMVSPAWNSVFTGHHKPEPYSPDVVKSVVIMTDGLFNTSYMGGYDHDTQPAIDESYAQFIGLCTQMKAKGVAVYTVLFGTVDPMAETKLKACASSPGNYYLASNGTQLQASFQQIADKLNNLRITK
jgi:Flp pilus assembly protein TadG